MDNYIVLDLEWNQCPRGREYSKEGLPFEIIEFGAIKLDAEFKAVDKFHRVVKPQVYKQMHFRVHEVVQMGIEELKKNGIPFNRAIKEFFEFCEMDNLDKKKIICTWGELDLLELQRNIKYFKAENKFEYPLFFYDIQKLFNILYPAEDQDRITLENAVNILGVDIKRPFHHALDDAYYTVEVMQKMDFDSVRDFYSLDYYHVPKTSDEEIYLHFPGYSKFVSMLYSTKEEAISNKHNADLICDRCNRMLKKKVKWFSTNQKNYYALGVCPEHGYVKGRMRVRKSDDKYYIIKTTKIVGTEVYEELKKKKEENQKKKIVKNMRKA